MKKIVFTLLAGAMLLASCSSKEGSSIKSGSKEGDTTAEGQATIKNEKTMGTIKMTKADFLTKVHNYEKDMETWKYLGDKPAIIDFYADWCGPCKQIAPILEELAKEYSDEIYIYKVDVDSEEELAALFNIRSIPSMLFIPMDGQPQMAAGAAPKTELIKSIDNVLLSN